MFFVFNFRKVLLGVGFLLYSLTLNTFADVNILLKAELEGYKIGVQNMSGQDLIVLSDIISSSGIVDDELHHMVAERAKQEYKIHLASSSKEHAKTVTALIRALGSFGRDEDLAFLREVTQGAKFGSVKNRAKQVRLKSAWYKKRNQAMQQTSYYENGQSLFTYRFMGLLYSKDPSIRRWAAEEVHRQGGADDLIYETMAQMVKAEGVFATEGVHVDALAWFCRILSTYDVEHYGEFLTYIKNDKNYHDKIRRYANV